MAEFDAAYQDPATQQRIERDIRDGRALGVAGTPTFFVDGVALRPRSADDLCNAVEAALG